MNSSGWRKPKAVPHLRLLPRKPGWPSKTRLQSSQSILISLRGSKRRHLSRFRLPPSLPPPLPNSPLLRKGRVFQFWIPSHARRSHRRVPPPRRPPPPQCLRLPLGPAMLSPLPLPSQRPQPLPAHEVSEIPTMLQGHPSRPRTKPLPPPRLRLRRLRHPLPHRSLQPPRTLFSPLGPPGGCHGSRR